MRNLRLGAVLVFAVAATSCGGDDFSSESPSPDAAVQGDAESETGPADAALQDATSEDAEQTCSLQTTLAPCDECINMKCLEPCQKCAENTSCVEIYGCVISTCVGESGVPDQACAQGCVQAHPAGLATFGAFWAGFSPGCVASKCAAVCPW